MIVLITGASDSGKDTFAKLLKERIIYPTVITHFADSLKWMYEKYLDWDGDKDSIGRKGLQTLGTEIGRFYNPGIWTNYVIDQVNLFHNFFSVFIVADLRFPDEQERMETYFGANNVITVEIKRADAKELPEELSKHSSETSLFEIQPTFFVENTSLQELERGATAISNFIQYKIRQRDENRHWWER